MRRREVIHVMFGLLGFGALGGRSARASGPREIRLSGMHVAGTSYYAAAAAADGLRPGQRLVLRRQPDNVHDALAIEVFGPAGHKLGYVPRQYNKMPARLMDAGQRLSARMESLSNQGTWLSIRVSLHMVVSRQA